MLKEEQMEIRFEICNEWKKRIADEPDILSRVVTADEP